MIQLPLPADAQRMLEEALEFYAREETYRPSLEVPRDELGRVRARRRPCLRDRGQRARDVLAVLRRG